MSRGWSQAELAELLSVTRQTLIVIEQSKTDPSLAMRVGWLFRKPVESIFLADIDEQVIALKETGEYKAKTATAFDEMGVLERMGEEGTVQKLIVRDVKCFLDGQR
jgi:putative transcriptional regulator